MLTCPVALLADVTLWTFRAGILLMMRLTTAVALAATAFSAAILVAENVDFICGTVGAKSASPSAIIDRPLFANTSGGPIRIATIRY
jgi:hypothetical protein